MYPARPGALLSCMVPGFDVVSAQRRLQALVAAISAFPEEQQPGVLRSYLEMQLDRLEALEDSHQQFLAECVLLAVDNMQDARLQCVEDRLAALESPDGPSLGEILTDAMLTMVFAALALGAVESLGGLVLLFFGEAAAAPAARLAAEEADAALLATSRSQVASAAQLRVRAQTVEQQVRGMTSVVEAMGGGSLSSNAWQAAKAVVNPIASARTARDAVGSAFRLVAEGDEIVTQMLIGQEAESLSAATAIQARLAYAKALQGDAERPNAAWRRFLDDAPGNLLLAPAAAVFEKAWAAVKPQDRPPGGPDDPGKQAFLASGPAGRILGYTQDQRVRIAREYAMLHAGLRNRPDTTFIADRLVVQLSGLVVELVPLRESYFGLRDTVRPMIVRGYEAALWWAYLQSNGFLDVKTGQTYQHFSDALTVGAIREGRVVTKIPPRRVPGGLGTATYSPDLMFEYSVDYHYGILALEEGQAEYLYDAFAGPYFRAGDHATTLPFPFDPARYVGVRAMSRRSYLVLDNEDRQARLDEMRFMVIRYFRLLPTLQDPIGMQQLQQLGAVFGATPSTDGWVSLFPAATVPAPDQLESARPPLSPGSAAAIRAMLTDAHALDGLGLQVAKASLSTALTELRNDIEEIQAIDRGDLSAGESSRGLDVEAYAKVIRDEQTALKALYPMVLNAAGSDEAEVTRVRTVYDGLVQRLTTWTLPRKTQRVPARLWQIL